MLGRLGAWAAHRHWWVITLWIAVIVGIGGVAASHHGTQEDQFSIPGTQSQKATNLLETSFPAVSGTSALVVVQSTGARLDVPAYAQALGATATDLSALPGAGTAASPLTPVPVDLTGAGPTYGTPDLSPDGRVGYIPVQFDTSPTQAGAWTVLYHKVEAAAAPCVHAGLAVRIGGPVADAGNPPPPGISKYSEEIGLLCALVILLLALGSAVSMVIPIGIAILSVGVSTEIVSILSAGYTIGTVAPILGSMIGLGVGIDYSLFIVSRFRQHLTGGSTPVEAVSRALATSGSAVLFAGATVCIAMCGLLIVGIPYVTQLGFVASMYVVVTVALALTLLPAILGALGSKVGAGHIHSSGDTVAPARATLSARWASAMARRPTLYAAAALLVLGALAIPLASMELGFTDDGNLPASNPQRQAYDVIASSFGQGVNSPLLVAIRLPAVTPSTASALLDAGARLVSALKSTPGVQSVSIPVPNRTLPFVAKPDTPPGSSNPADYTYDFTPSHQPTAVIIRVIARSAPNDPATTDLVGNLRSKIIPAALNSTALPASRVFVGGQTAVLIDVSHAISRRLGIFIAAVVAFTMILLMMVFRSLVIPVNAAVMNLLSIGAAYGVIVLVFQHGIGRALIGLATAVPIVAFVPVMMFAILFGLSMDYEVFLLSRIREEYSAAGDPSACIIEGLSKTARVITSAALIMISVFLAFVPNPNPTVKMIGFGMAAAVFLDATIVRMVLVPATLELTRSSNWKFPSSLDRVLPRIHVD